MEEEEWLTCTYPTPMLEEMPEQTWTERKLRLFTVACCRRVWEYLPGPGSRRAVEIAERYADANATAGELEAAHTSAERHKSADHGEVEVVQYATSRRVDADGCTLYTSLLAADSAAGAEPDSPEAGKRWDEADSAESSAQANLLRDIFGNPFRPVTFAPAWRTSDVILLAQGIYDDRAFDRMPILADALQDAGCNVDELLNHLRNTQQTHVRGCWALDLVLEKV